MKLLYSVAAFSLISENRKKRENDNDYNELKKDYDQLLNEYNKLIDSYNNLIDEKDEITLCYENIKQKNFNLKNTNKRQKLRILELKNFNNL